MLTSNPLILEDLSDTPGLQILPSFELLKIFHPGLPAPGRRVEALQLPTPRLDILHCMG